MDYQVPGKVMKKFQDINDLTGAVIGAAIEVHKFQCSGAKRRHQTAGIVNIFYSHESSSTARGGLLLLDRRLPIQQKNNSSVTSVSPW